MKKVLLISNYVYHYRINNYNYFWQQFRNQDTDFQVLADGAQQVDFRVDVPLHIRKPGFLSYLRFIKEYRPQCIILFLHLKDLFFFPLVLYCRLKKIPVAYWNFGIDVGEPDNRLKNFFYRLLHSLVDAVLLYSPNEKVFIHPEHHRKTFVANNTVNMTELDTDSVSGNILREKYHISERSIVLFVGRIIRAKRVDLLLQCFRDHPEVAVVIAGKGMPEELLNIVDAFPNYHYLGEIRYDKTALAEIVHAADVVCIPGNVGLAIVEAFFWGKPLVTITSMRGLNSPEIFYLKEGENGYICRDEREMEEKILGLLADREKYMSFSGKARETALTEAHISKMFKGFSEVVQFLTPSR